MTSQGIGTEKEWTNEHTRQFWHWLQMDAGRARLATAAAVDGIETMTELMLDLAWPDRRPLLGIWVEFLTYDFRHVVDWAQIRAELLHLRQRGQANQPRPSLGMMFHGRYKPFEG